MAGKRRCWKCRKVSEITEMRYDRSGRDLICPECLRIEKRGNMGKGMETETATVTGTAAKNKLQPDNIRGNSYGGSDGESTTISYQCGSCGLGFSEKRGARVKCCPYCGKGNFRVAFRDSAQGLIEESAADKFGN